MSTANYLLRKSQLAQEIESTAGTAEALAASDVTLKPLSDGFTYEADPRRFENLEVADDIGTAADFVVAVPGRLNVPVTLKASGVLATAPAIGKLLRMCGLKQQQVKTINLGAVSGGDAAIAAGDTYDVASGSKTGIIDEAVSSSGGTAVTYIELTGGALAASDQLDFTDNDTSTASGTSADVGWKYTPTTDDQETGTIQRLVTNTDGTAAEDNFQRLRGAMGTCTLDIEALNAGRCNFVFTGVEDGAAYDGTAFTGTTPESVAIADVPKLINAVLQVDSKTIRPQQVSFDLGNEIVLEPDVTAAGGDTAGFDFARVSARNPTIRVDPRAVQEFDDHAKLRAGSVMPFRLTFGTSPQQIDIVVTAGQLTELTMGDRDNFATAEKVISLRRHATLVDHEYAIYFL